MNSIQKLRCRPRYSSMHRMIGAIADKDFRKPLFGADATSVGTHRHIGCRKRVQQMQWGLDKPRKLVLQSSLRSLCPSACVVRHELDYRGEPPFARQEVSTIERVESGAYDLWRIPDVVEPSGHDQSLSVLNSYCSGELVCSHCNLAYVAPAAPEGGQQRSAEGLRPSCQVVRAHRPQPLIPHLYKHTPDAAFGRWRTAQRLEGAPVPVLNSV